MKKNWKSILCEITEYLALIAPTMGYSIYVYVETLEKSMSSTSKGAFWTLISASIVVAVIFRVFKKRYERFVQGYVQQKTDLETKPNDELLIKKVAEKSTIIENVDYLICVIPLLIFIVILSAFAQAIEQLILILEIMACSLVAKVGLHALTLHLERGGMLNSIAKRDGETK